MPRTVFLIAAARPNFMKVAPLWRALAARPGLRPVLIHTGQHYDRNMSDVFFEDLGLPRPDVHLGVGGGSHAEQTAGVMLKFEELCLGRAAGPGGGRRRRQRHHGHHRGRRQAAHPGRPRGGRACAAAT